MNSSLENQAIQRLKSWVRDDSFVCAIHISSGRYSQELMLEVLGKFVKAKLNKYLVGRRWRKLHNSNHLQIVWVKEGVDISNTSVKGYFNGSGYINKKVRLKSTDVQSHYHCLVKCGVDLKNTRRMGIDFKHDVANLVELTLLQIFSEYQYARAQEELTGREDELKKLDEHRRRLKINGIKKKKYLDIELRNCHEDDFAQQSYVMKALDKDSDWGIL